MPLGELHEHRGLRAVHHVVGQRVGAEYGRLDGRHLGLQAAGGGVDDDIEHIADGQVVVAAADQFDFVQLGRRLEALHQPDGAIGRAIGDEHARRLVLQQRQQDAACRAARAEQQHAFARQCVADVVRDVAHQADAVGVVAENLIAVELERVDGAGRFRPQRQRGRQRIGIELERHRHVEPPPALADEREHGLVEGDQLGIDALVAHRLAGLLREGGMDGGRLAVRDRVADHAIAVDRRGIRGRDNGLFRRCHRVCSWVSRPARVNLKVATTSWMSTRLRISAGKAPNGADERTMATAWRSSAGLPELLATSMPSIL